MSNVIYIEDTGQLKLDRANRILAGIPSGVWKAAHGAIGRAAEKAKTESGRFAAEQYTISKGQFMSHVRTKTKLSGGSGGVASARILFAGSVIPLIEFQTRFSKEGGVTVSVKKGGGGNLAHAFVANIGGTNIYERVGKARFPVEKKYGPSAAHMMAEETVVENMEHVIVDTFNSRIEHEITRVLNGWGG